ncbi:MAG: hypothetical protein KGZ66_11815 [Selenomonadales bacterium]|nr:hypothetical protein [Selenomonadales bacterium]
MEAAELLRIIREEMQRMFQSSSLIHGDEVPVHNLTVDALDMHEFRHYIKQQYGDVELEGCVTASLMSPGRSFSSMNPSGAYRRLW